MVSRDNDNSRVHTLTSIAEGQVKTYALQVYEPSSYESTQDADALETMYLAYIPTGQVDTLAQQLLVKTSAFYTGLGNPYAQLANLVVSSFPVESVQAPGGNPAGPQSNNDSAGGATSSSGSSKTREDAIIGVVSSLGAITLIVLAFLVVRAVKQRRALAHRRLSEPTGGVDENDFVGARPDGQEFDRDSVGGQRRRSFYYAEDSLRGFEGTSEQMMRERRPVNAQMIGAPVLRDNTMNW